MTIASARQVGTGLQVERLLADPAARPSGAALVGALASDLDGAVLVLGADGAVLARAGSAAGARVAQRAVSAVSAGGGAEPDRGAGHRDWSVRVWPLAAGGARSLVAARRQPWTSPIENTAVRAATIIATALLADQNDTERDRLIGGRRAVWGSVAQLLMTGRVAEAQRVANALEPELLDVARVRLHVLAGRPRDRDTLLGACEARLAGTAVSVPCPARSGHVVVFEPVSGTGPGSGSNPGSETAPVNGTVPSGGTSPANGTVPANGTTPGGAGESAAGAVPGSGTGPSSEPETAAREHSPVRTALAELTAGSKSRSLGSSRIHPIGATATAYSQAIGALAAAAVRPDRMADAEQRRELADVLPSAAAGWASALLAPLAAGDEDGTLRHTLAIALIFTRAEAAAILGVHRNTVHARVSAAAQLLGVDLDRLPQRAAIDLALRAQRGAGAGDLPEVLGDAQLKAWAADLLDRLDAAVAPRGPARMRDLLRAFTHADGGITAAAYSVGMSPNSATRWLVAAEAVGGLRLRHGCGGAHEVAVALAATEGLTLLPAR